MRESPSKTIVQFDEFADEETVARAANAVARSALNGVILIYGVNTT